MLPDRGIWQAATAVVKRHNSVAIDEAGKRVDELEYEGDPYWRINLEPLEGTVRLAISILLLLQYSIHMNRAGFTSGIHFVRQPLGPLVLERSTLCSDRKSMLVPYP